MNILFLWEEIDPYTHTLLDRSRGIYFHTTGIERHFVIGNVPGRCRVMALLLFISNIGSPLHSLFF